MWSKRLDWFRAVGLLAVIGLIAVTVYPVARTGSFPTAEQWWQLLAAFVIALLSQMGVRWSVDSPLPVTQPIRKARLLAGLCLAIAGAVLCGYASWALYLDWVGHFDRSWMSWLVGAGLIGLGADLAWGRWRMLQALRDSSWVFAVLGAVCLLGGLVRLGYIAEFPGPHGITQIEDLQFGNFGGAYLDGYRLRWEMIGHAWISALGLTIGQNDFISVRVAYAVVGTLMVPAVFLWLRWEAGNVAALVGTGLLIVSSWDAVVARIGFNPNATVVAAIFALLVGPVRRGRPSAFAAMGLLCGYILWEYIAYRFTVPLALAGAGWISLHDSNVGWWRRLFRPLLMVALIACMVFPLFGNRLHGRFYREYADGLKRARADRSYYGDRQDWRQALEKRLVRSRETIGLFFFLGDSFHSRNVGRRPLVDAASATFMTIGLAYCLGNPFTGLFGLFGYGFVLVSMGAMVVTADFNPLRMSVTIPYAYFLAGVGAASLVEIWRRAWGRGGRWVALSVTLAACVWATYSNGTFLLEYWTSPEIRRRVRSEEAFLADWLRRNVRPGEQVVGATWRYRNLLRGSDSAWLRGTPLSGVLTWDIHSALDQWRDDGPTLFVVYTGVETEMIVEALRTAFPETDLVFDKDEIDGTADIGYARFSEKPKDFDQALRRFTCRGVRIRSEVRGQVDGKPKVSVVEQVSPVISPGTAAGENLNLLRHGERGRPVEKVRVETSYEAVINIEKPGRYTFSADHWKIDLKLFVDGKAIRLGQPIFLDEGKHQFTGRDQWRSRDAYVLRVYWSGPDSGTKKELIPFYRIAEPGPTCDT